MRNHIQKNICGGGCGGGGGGGVGGGGDCGGGRSGDVCGGGGDGMVLLNIVIDPFSGSRRRSGGSISSISSNSSNINLFLVYVHA